jgi:hypothetical protein
MKAAERSSRIASHPVAASSKQEVMGMAWDIGVEWGLEGIGVDMG